MHHAEPMAELMLAVTVVDLPIGLRDDITNAVWKAN